jgi:hypothetical protein
MKIYQKVQDGEIDMPKPPSPSTMKPRPKKRVEKPTDQYLPSDAFSQSLSKPKEETKEPPSWPRPLQPVGGFVDRGYPSMMMPPLFQSHPSPTQQKESGKIEAPTPTSLPSLPGSAALPPEFRHSFMKPMDQSRQKQE